MRRFLGHPLFLAALTIAILYVVFAHLLQPPLPRSLLIQYMVICVVGVLLVVSFDDATAKRFGAPISALMGSPGLRIARFFALIAVSGGAAALAYEIVRPGGGSPLELRTVHPAPPSTLRVYGQSYDLLTLENPVRAENPEGSDGYAEAVLEGGELYYANCLYCHGDYLDGKGHFGEAFNPRPANFQDVGTIAQLQESYLFWRITTGGPGLPREGAPWASAMPVWHEMLEEEEVWKIITFLYDYTGHAPRSWELEESATEGEAAEAVEVASGDLDEEAVEAIYMNRCAQCHGEDGDGEGVAAEFMYPRPRDFTLAQFKFKTTQADVEFPSQDDFRETIRDGLPGTAMPGWKGVLSDAEIDALIQLIKEFGGWEEEEIEYLPIEMGDPSLAAPDQTPEVLANGRAQFVKACVQCHGEEGRGDVNSGKKLADDLENRIWPRNLTRPETWRATKTAADVFQRLSTGIRGTPMPEHSTTMSIGDRWAIAHYVMTLRGNSVPLSAGETVIRAALVDGALPTDPADPAWDTAPAMTFALAPNVIKEPRLFYSLNDMVTVRALYNSSDIALRLDVDDRTYSVPGDELEMRYRLDDVEPTSDAVAVQLPMQLSGTSEKPWFRHGDKRNGVNMWLWTAPNIEAGREAGVMVLDAAGPDAPPTPRAEASGLSGGGVWRNGRWQVVFQRALTTESVADLQIVEGRHIPIAFANWDGLAGEKGGRHSFTSWYWLLLEREEDRSMLYGAPASAGLLAGLLFIFVARRQRKSWSG